MTAHDKNWGITVASDDYLRYLGRLVYSQAYLEWALFDVLRKIDPSVNLENLAGMDAGGILRQACQVANTQTGTLRAALDEVCNRFDQARLARNDIVHARPSTDTDGTTQVLFRWAPAKVPPVPARPIRQSDIEQAIDLVERTFAALARCEAIFSSSTPNP